MLYTGTQEKYCFLCQLIIDFVLDLLMLKQTESYIFQLR